MATKAGSTSLIKQYFQVPLVLAALYLLGRYVYFRWLEVSQVEIGFFGAPLLVGVLLLLGFYIGYSQSWQRMLDWMSDEPPKVGRLVLYRVFFVSFISRYLPAGSVLQLGGRVELLRREGGRRAFGVQSLYYEQLYLVGGAGLLAWLALIVRPFPWLPAWLDGPSPLWSGLGLLLCLVILTVPEIALRIGKSLLPAANLQPKITVPNLRLRHRVELLVRFFLVNLAQGCAAYFILWSIYPGTPSIPGLLLMATAAYPLSRIAGQMAPLVPGGIGVREGAFTFLLGPFLPVQPIILCAALIRLVSVVMEIAILFLLLALLRRRPGGADTITSVR